MQCGSVDEFISPILPSSRGFKLAKLNITSLVKHIDELRILLADTPVDVLSINETRLDDSVKDSDVYIPGYEIIRRDRERNGRLGGGVCFFVRSNISYSLRPDLSIHQLENLCIEIRKPRSKPFLVVTWYRPPDSSVEIFTYFESLIGKIDAEYAEFYLMGDLNCNFAAPQLDHNANLLSSIADVYSLQQLITDPTRCTESSSTLIDHIFTTWITPRLKKRLHARDILKLKATRSGDADDWRNFKNLRNTVNSEIKRVKECQYKHALNALLRQNPSQ